ncbi:RimJ/RimL family protein N-acetyltransferase [Kitasatospora sp. MAP12-15]|uniref:GNAT family N-acetyltransferase n=1 Tax=unclassified Kitasatospora TaxID=2633591 RepID=UPI00247487CF|nr:GNAT family N-acetyltransferase [Kitasatospora sp. MAP12-44]MDH6111688.1 RimJ/RimL family protein N-acetyltransferase [Kitasatospora sp. MAP12-44]
MSDAQPIDRPTFELVLTERLELRAVTPDDLDELYAINSDPGTWRHQPEGRHAAPVTTKEWIERAVARWDEGLSYWTARLRSDGTVVGVGGVQHIPAFGGWNLYYRLATAHWGRGYATELSRAAIEAARLHTPQLPVVAWIHAHNEGSRAVAARLDLIDHGLLPHPFYRQDLHLFTDRETPGC